MSPRGPVGGKQLLQYFKVINAKAICFVRQLFVCKLSVILYLYFLLGANLSLVLGALYTVVRNVILIIFSWELPVVPSGKMFFTGVP
jgi:hypothetical protein